jgi:hypothetical protein
MLSKLRGVSIATVIEDKPRDSKVIKVHLVEHHSLTDGYLDEPIQEETLLNDSAEKVKLESAPYIKATWLQISEPNRATSPDVCRGETVFVSRYGETDEYYWWTIYGELHLRNTERIIYRYSNKKDNAEALDTTNSYSTMFSTLDKLISLETVDNDGELTTYTIYLNTKDGVLHIEDGRANVVELNSAGDAFNIMTNNSINFDTSVFNVNAPTINFNSSNITFNSDVITFNSNDFNINSNMAVGPSAASGGAGAMKINAEITHTGNTSISGNLNVGGTSYLTGAVESDEDMTATGFNTKD